MKKFRLVPCICAGVLAISLGIAGCGRVQNSAATSDTASSADGAPAEQKAPRTLYWRGTTDTGETFYFMEDEAAKTADVLIIPTEEEGGEPFHAEGNYSLSTDGTATITAPEEEESEDSSSKDEKHEPYAFSITDVNETSLLIDAGEHGKATLTPITEEEHKEILVAYGYAEAEEPVEEDSAE